MGALKQIDLSAVLHHDRWSRLKPDGEKLGSPTEVSGKPDIYKFSSGLRVTVNPDGSPPVKVRYCGGGDFDCNFFEGEALLAADDPDSIALPNHAPICLHFSKPVKAVGCQVAGAGKAELYGQPYTAMMFARLKGNANWEVPVAAGGLLDQPKKPGNFQGIAPFVGAQVTGKTGIEAVSFDVALMANFRFEQVAIATLYYLL